MKLQAFLFAELTEMSNMIYATVFIYLVDDNDDKEKDEEEEED